MRTVVERQGQNLSTLESPECVGSPGGASGKEPPASAGAADTGSVPGSAESPGEGDGSPPSILVWETQWTEEPGGLQSMGSQRIGQD